MPNTSKFLVIDPCYLPNTEDGVEVALNGLPTSDEDGSINDTRGKPYNEDGTAAVDSGQLLVIPIEGAKAWGMASGGRGTLGIRGYEDDDYAKACHASSNGGTFTTTAGYEAFCFTTHEGDGTYEVRSQNGRLYIDTGNLECIHCEGEGTVWGTIGEDCTDCGGDGSTECGDCDGDGAACCDNTGSEDCYTCNGKGIVPVDGEEQCFECDGRGTQR